MKQVVDVSVKEMEDKEQMATPVPMGFCDVLCIWNLWVVGLFYLQEAERR